MKRIIYTAVALIICASVFGIADYLNAKKKGTLVNYTDDLQSTEIVAEKKATSVPAKNEISTEITQKEISKGAKSEKKLFKIKKDPHFTNVEDLILTEKTKEPLPGKIDQITLLLESKATDVMNDSVMEKDSKRRINMEMFSRAPIREKKLKRK